MVNNEPNVTTIAGSRGMTRSDRMFTPINDQPLAKAKGKEIVSNTQNSIQNTKPLKGSSSPKAAAYQKEAKEFLIIIMKSDYKVVDQVNHIPSNISILSLLLSLEAHCGSLWES